MAFPDKPVAQLLGSNGPIHAVAYSASPGTYVLTGGADRSVRLYNPAPTTAVHPNSSYITKQQQQDAAAIPAGRLIQTFSAHGYEVLSLAVASDNARFVSAGGDRAAFLWDVASGKTLRRFGGGSTGGHSSRINSVTFAGEGESLVVTGGFDTTVRIWDAKGAGSARPIMVLGDAGDSVSAVAATTRGGGGSGSEVVAASVDGRVRSYDVRMGKLTTDVLPASAASLCLSRDGRTALVGALDSKLRLMDRETGACLKTYADPGWRNEELRVQSVLGGKERFVVAGDELTAPPETSGGLGGGAAAEGRIWAWDLLSGKLVARVRVPWGPGGSDGRKRVVGRDGKEKERKNVISCIAWKEDGYGDQFCVGGTSGVATVFGAG